MINPEEYTVSVRVESVDGDRMYVARIQELPEVEEYADTAEFARELALDTIATMYDICVEKGLSFPPPIQTPAPEASGRVTLRLPKSVHAASIQRAALEGVSLNQLLSNAISSALSQKGAIDATRDAFLDFMRQESATVKPVDVRLDDLFGSLSWENNAGVEFSTKSDIAKNYWSLHRSSIVPGLMVREFEQQIFKTEAKLIMKQPLAVGRLGKSREQFPMQYHKASA